MTSTTQGPASVHRLIDMVVEEVSLVDRAANKHRFLLVKRDGDTMHDAPQDTAPAEGESHATSDTSKAEDTLLTAAQQALEAVTALVEALSSTDGIDGVRVVEVAQHLRALADALEEDEDDSEDEKAVEARAKAANPVPAPQPTPQPAPPAPSPDASGVMEGLTKLTDAVRALEGSVKEQHQRLGRVEKQFGLPNSSAPAERPPKPAVEDVGWPLDMNKPLNRESVDKALSFHDV
jgi:pyruvate/2-oxoglutarate dehydrogenase complex dihydrolipoamide acyltransferase (E2) component